MIVIKICKLLYFYSEKQNYLSKLFFDYSIEYIFQKYYEEEINIFLKRLKHSFFGNFKKVLN